jgi:hypothetical protein
MSADPNNRSWDLQLISNAHTTSVWYALPSSSFPTACCSANYIPCKKLNSILKLLLNKIFACLLPYSDTSEGLEAR